MSKCKPKLNPIINSAGIYFLNSFLWEIECLWDNETVTSAITIKNLHDL